MTQPPHPTREPPAEASHHCRYRLFHLWRLLPVRCSVSHQHAKHTARHVEPHPILNSRRHYSDHLSIPHLSSHRHRGVVPSPRQRPAQKLSGQFHPAAWATGLRPRRRLVAGWLVSEIAVVHGSAGADSDQRRVPVVGRIGPSLVANRGHREPARHIREPANAIYWE